MAEGSVGRRSLAVISVTGPYSIFQDCASAWSGDPSLGLPHRGAGHASCSGAACERRAAWRFLFPLTVLPLEGIQRPHADHSRQRGHLRSVRSRGGSCQVSAARRVAAYRLSGHIVWTGSEARAMHAVRVERRQFRSRLSPGRRRAGSRPRRPSSAERPSCAAGSCRSACRAAPDSPCRYRGSSRLHPQVFPRSARL